MDATTKTIQDGWGDGMSEWVADIERIADEIHNAYEEGYADGKRDAVVHGHWEMKWHIYLHQELPVCSHCKKFVVAMSAYCPLCGTIMDEPTQSNDSNALDALEGGKQCD